MTTKEDYLFLVVKTWLYGKLNSGEIEAKSKSMDLLAGELRKRFEQGCKDFVDRDEYHTERRIVFPKEARYYTVLCKTSSPILERLMQRVTPETLAKAKRVMIQDVIDNMNSQYEEYLKHLGTPKDMADAQLFAHARGLNDMFAFLEDLTK